MLSYGDYLYEEYLEETRKSDRVALAVALAKANFSKQEDNKNDRWICEGAINQEENKRIVSN